MPLTSIEKRMSSSKEEDEEQRNGPINCELNDRFKNLPDKSKAQFFDVISQLSGPDTPSKLTDSQMQALKEVATAMGQGSELQVENTDCCISILVKEDEEEEEEEDQSGSEKVRDKGDVPKDPISLSTIRTKTELEELTKTKFTDYEYKQYLTECRDNPRNIKMMEFLRNYAHNHPEEKCNIARAFKSNSDKHNGSVNLSEVMTELFGNGTRCLTSEELEATFNDGTSAAVVEAQDGTVRIMLKNLQVVFNMQHICRDTTIQFTADICDMMSSNRSLNFISRLMREKHGISSEFIYESKDEHGVTFTDIDYGSDVGPPLTLREKSKLILADANWDDDPSQWATVHDDILSARKGKYPVDWKDQIIDRNLWKKQVMQLNRNDLEKSVSDLHTAQEKSSSSSSSSSDSLARPTCSDSSSEVSPKKKGKQKAVDPNEKLKKYLATISEESKRSNAILYGILAGEMKTLSIVSKRMRMSMEEVFEFRRSIISAWQKKPDDESFDAFAARCIEAAKKDVNDADNRYMDFLKNGNRLDVAARAFQSGALSKTEFNEVCNHYEKTEGQDLVRVRTVEAFGKAALDFMLTHAREFMRTKPVEFKLESLEMVHMCGFDACTYDPSERRLVNMRSCDFSRKPSLVVAFRLRADERFLIPVNPHDVHTWRSYPITDRDFMETVIRSGAEIEDFMTSANIESERHLKVLRENEIERARVQAMIARAAEQTVLHEENLRQEEERYKQSQAYREEVRQKNAATRAKEKQKQEEKNRRAQEVAEQRAKKQEDAKQAQARQEADIAIQNAIKHASDAWENGNRADAKNRIQVATTKHSPNASEECKSELKLLKNKFAKIERDEKAASKPVTVATVPPSPPQVQPDPEAVPNADAKSKRKSKPKRDKKQPTTQPQSSEDAKADEEPDQQPDLLKLIHSINLACNKSMSNVPLPAPSPPPVSPSVDPSSASSSTSSTSSPHVPNDDSDLCVICLDERKTHLCAPCGHLCLCAGCSNRMHDDAGKKKKMACPICRQSVKMMVKIHY